MTDDDRDARARRRASRRRGRADDPSALAERLVGQLSAYSCSTIYAPSRTRVRSFVRELVLPRLERALEVRSVVVERWSAPGPTTRALVDALRSQLELASPGAIEEAPLAALRRALRQAERRSDRPLLLVLHDLERLLDPELDPRELEEFVDGLAYIAALPVTGLRLVLCVHEEALGEFRDLLRGRWRLLANDIRLHPEGERWALPVPLPLGGAAAVAAQTGLGGRWLAAALVAAGVTAAAAAGVAVQKSRSAAEAERERAACLERLVAPRECPLCPNEHVETDASTSSAPAVATDAPDASSPRADPLSSADVGDPSTDGQEAPDLGATEESADSDTGGELGELVEPEEPKARDLCEPARGDGDCAQCVRSKCCEALRKCKRSKWRRCVLRERVGQPGCRPASIERSCRGLALCALEYQCQADCYQHKLP